MWQRLEKKKLIWAALQLRLGNQTVKANLKAFTLGLKEDCQGWEVVKLYTIISKSVGEGYIGSPQIRFPLLS